MATFLVVETVNDSDALMSAIEGALDVLADDGAAMSPLAEDYTAILDLLSQGHVLPHSFELDGALSGEQQTLLSDVVTHAIASDSGFTSYISHE